MKVFKYQLSASAPITELLLPYDAKFLSFGVQAERLYVWALVHPDNEPRFRYVEVFPTGGDRVVPAKAAYIGTVHVDDGLVWHAFEVRP